MLLAEVFAELRFTTPSPSVWAVVFRTFESGSVYLFFVALEASPLRKKFITWAASTPKVFTRTSGRCTFFRLFIPLGQINVPKQIEGPHNLPRFGCLHCVASNLRCFHDWRRAMMMN